MFGEKHLDKPWVRLLDRRHDGFLKSKEFHGSTTKPLGDIETIIGSPRPERLNERHSRGPALASYRMERGRGSAPVRSERLRHRYSLEMSGFERVRILRGERPWISASREQRDSSYTALNHVSKICRRDSFAELDPSIR